MGKISQTTKISYLNDNGSKKMSKKPTELYDNLHTISKKGALLTGISSLLDWDQETYMPKGANGNRSEQMQLLAELIHQEKTGAKFVKALSKLIDLETGTVLAKELSSKRQAALKRWRRDYQQAVALPKSFVSKFALARSHALGAWREARENDDFESFAPHLEKIVECNKKKADYLGYDEHPYDALLDEYEPEISTSEVDKLFGSLKKSISLLLKKIEKAKQVNDNFLHGSFSPQKQLKFGTELLEEMGFSLDNGRIDLSTHPFSSSSHPSDSRVTTRVSKTSLMTNLFAVLHEGGHSLYEMGLPEKEYGSPLCEAVSLGIHESQSRFWETRIGMTKGYWKHYLPKLKSTFKGKFDNVSLDRFYKAINKVEPTFIRVEADEVTYPLHVILRFELEKALIEGKISVSEVPEAWNEKMTNMLGITPSTYAEGCLQDIHWSMGAFGYFPTYTLGNVYAGQLFEAFATDYPTWEKHLAKGELSFIKEWLQEKVYQHGRRYNSRELIKKATGKKFSEKPYLNYLNNKYQEIYRL